MVVALLNVRLKVGIRFVKLFLYASAHRWQFLGQPEELTLAAHVET